VFKRLYNIIKRVNSSELKYQQRLTNPNKAMRRGIMKIKLSNSTTLYAFKTMDSMLQNLVVRHTSWVEEAK
jgi:ribosomal protein L15E